MTPPLLIVPAAALPAAAVALQDSVLGRLPAGVHPADTVLAEPQQPVAEAPPLGGAEAERCDQRGHGEHRRAERDRPALDRRDRADLRRRLRQQHVAGHPAKACAQDPVRPRRRPGERHGGEQQGRRQGGRAQP